MAGLSSNSVSYSIDPSTLLHKPSSDHPDYNSPPTTWDVFLSFCGEDTRYKFTSHLYAALDRHGVRTFMDDPELPTGEVISDALIQAIHDSKIYVVVFSENYAYSSWCLDELVEIYKCYRQMKRLVIGVYCNIDPSVVRTQKESFEKAFEKHVQCRDDMDKVNEWRDTLTNVANISGKHIVAQRSEAHVIDEIVDIILRDINPKTLDVAKFPVGLDYHVKCITTLLNQGTKEGVIRIGLYGMGGVGKTTLAKALYNNLLVNFKHSCFLANIREVSKTTKGLVSLQEQLIDDVLKSKRKIEVRNVEEGTQLIRYRICSAKVLVIMDDIDDLEPYELLAGPFASGSIVIITTRDQEILDKIKVEPIYCYEVNVLNDADSLTLLSRHAFGSAEPDNKLTVYFKDIIGLAGRLPLALKVFGSYLSTQSVVGWRSYIQILKQNPNSTIHQKFIISLDRLDSEDHNLKKLFLDIACFFVGWNINNVLGILETYYFHAEHKINILRKRCLLTLNDTGEVGMHDLIRDVGREVARNNSRDEPGEHSRLWVPEDINDVLKRHKGTKAIEGIIPSDFILSDFSHNYWIPVPDGSQVLLAAETFKEMCKLRFLCFKHIVHLNGNFEEVFDDLRWLCWDYCPLMSLPLEFYPPKLVVLELRSSKIRTMWELNKVVTVPHVFMNLKTLNMMNSKDLSTTPDFTILPHLETLNLAGCLSLEKVDISIGSLVKLICLDLCDCMKLTSLPDTICKLGALEILKISRCTSIKALPIELGKLKSLIELNAEVTQISEVPESIGHLSKLVFMNLSFNNSLKSLPDSICNLRALEFLDISHCSGLDVLPVELGNCEYLKELHAVGLNVLRLPDSIGRLSKLIDLRLSYNEQLTTLPDTISSMQSLSTLNIENCHYLSSVPELPPNLEYINADSCRSMESIQNLSKLKRLKHLDLRDCSRLTEIDGLEELNSISMLRLGGCNSVLLAKIMTKRLFQIYSEFGHEIKINIPATEFLPDWIVQSPYWIEQSSDETSQLSYYNCLSSDRNKPSSSLVQTISFIMPQNMTHDFLGIIVCCRPSWWCLDVKNITSGFTWHIDFVDVTNR